MTFVATDSSAAFTGRMAAATSGVGKGNREDLSDRIYMIDPEETPLLTMSKKVRATGTRHDWVSDALTAAATNEQYEGALYATRTMVAKTRYDNMCQISFIPYEVSKTQEAVSKVGLKSEFSYQALKAMKELKRDVNLDLWQNVTALTDTADPTDTARACDGLHHIIPSAHTGDAQYSKANMTGDAAEASFNYMLQDIYDGGPKSNLCYLLPEVKRYVSRWTGVATKYFDQKEKRLINVLSYYESDFGLVQFVMDRNMNAYADEGDMLVAGDFTDCAVAFLRPFTNERIDVPKSAHAGVVEVEFTLEYGHPGNYGNMEVETA